MKLVYYGKKKELLSFEKETQCMPLNQSRPNQEGYFIFDETKETVWKDGNPYVKGDIKNFIWKETLNDIKPMHLFMNHCELDKKWIYMNLRNKICSKDRVCILAFSFFDDTKNISDWNKQFKEGQGYFYPLYTNVFYKYGIKKENIVWVNYFTDNKSEIENKIKNSSILVLPGGAPELLMKRIKEFKLKSVLKRYKGIIIGVSAGAMAQLDMYHITPDDEYPSFEYGTGLGMVSGIDIEVHYRASRIQKESIERVKSEKNISIYGIYEDGALWIEDEKIQVLGRVDIL